MSKTMTPAEFAAEAKTDSRTVRKFLRSITPAENHPGKGARWELPGTKREVTRLTKQFTEWAATQKPSKESATAVEVEDTDMVEELEDLDKD